ncbi:MAG: hypothetical protein DA408_00010 [Bacteroidetes bacterium]|nr:MAG: hypothetical protein C7N36_18105 [Bacteroidota bacterium]PTM15042.1 MAG: hypothetical protein DA408_00010 [Bacteroidota bacterium]
MNYPKEHFQIVEALLREGRFLIEGEAAFATLKENRAFYQEFFKLSFQLDLELTADYALLKSSRNNDALARDICVFLGILCYEIDREGHNLMERLQFAVFSVEEIEQKLALSSFFEIIEATPGLKDEPTRRKFYNQMARRQLIIKQGEDAFRFTPAHRYFLEYARSFSRLIIREEEE